jgi:hypothetical protein
MMSSRLGVYNFRSSVSALVTDGFTVRVEDDRIASTIADDRAMASIQSESLSFVLGDQLFDRLADFRWPAPASSALHENSPLCENGQILFSKNNS